MTTQNSCNQTQTGIQVNSGTGIFSGRTITAGSTKISVTNGDGISNDPSIDIVQANLDINALGGSPLGADKGGTGVTSPTANGLLITNGASAMSALPLTDGQLVMGSTGASPASATLTAGSGISITNGAGSITINNTSQFIWSEITTTSASMSDDNGYVSNNPALVTLTLPTTSNVLTRIRIAGSGAGGWRISQNAGQNINFDSVSTTTGTIGYLSSINRNDAVELLCVVGSTTWNVISSMGNITII